MNKYLFPRNQQYLVICTTKHFPPCRIRRVALEEVARSIAIWIIDHVRSEIIGMLYSDAAELCRGGEKSDTYNNGNFKDIIVTGLGKHLYLEVGGGLKVLPLV